MQVDNTGGPLAPAVSSPMPPPASLALPVRAIPISHFLVSLLFKSLLLSLDILLPPQFTSAPLSITGSDGSLAKEGMFLLLFAFLPFNLSFYSSYRLSCYPGLLQAGHSCLELYALLLFSSRY